MSIAAAQYDKFNEQVAREEQAFTFTENGEFLVYAARDGDIVPFWSSRSRLETIQRRSPKYRRFNITELPFSEFYSLLKRLEAEGIHLGVNWSGERLNGYTVPVAQLREALDYWLDRLGKRTLISSA